MNTAALSAEATAKGQIQRACLDLLGQHNTDGTLPTSARFLYYELKQSGYPLKEHRARRPDQDVIDAIMALRVAGAVPWEWLADETRSTDAGHVAASVRQWVLDMLDGAQISPWQDHPRPLIVCESRGVRAALRPVALNYGARITSTNGQAGGFLRTDIGPVLGPGHPVAYFGDWNPAGESIEANTRRVLEREAAGPLDWVRLAVTAGQAEAEGLPAKPGTDKRYADGRPHDSYECEALGQRHLTGLLTGWLDAMLPAPLADVQEREAAQRAHVVGLLDGAGR